MDWKQFAVLLVLCIVSLILLIPYTLTLQADYLKSHPVDLKTILPLQIIQNAIFFAFVIFIGMSLSKRTGLKISEGKDFKKYLKSILKISVLLGILAGILIVALDLLFVKLINQASQTLINPPAWQGLLASFYGGINEEILMRFFAMNLVIWIFSLFTKGKPTEKGIWASILITSVLFGVGHLPITSTFTSITSFVIARAVILNSIAGIIYGWLFWKKGLASSMISHFSTDIVLHVLTLLLI